MRVPFLDLVPAYVGLKEELDQAYARVMASGSYILGPELEAFEQEFANYVGSGEDSAVAVSSCTTAMHAVLHAFGIGQGDEVITVSHSFIATANAIRYTGATPVFVDISFDDFTSRVGSKKVAAVSTRLPPSR